MTNLVFVWTIWDILGLITMGLGLLFLLFIWIMSRYEGKN